MHKQRFLITGMAAFCVICGIAGAADKGQPVRELEGRLALKTTDAQAWAKVMETGKQKSFLCAYCHGEDGNSVESFVPNLAAQNPRYLLDQTRSYADGRRKHFVMTPMIKQFSDDEIIASAVYYANMKVKQGTADKALAERGSGLYQGRCAGCHKLDAHGDETYARLAGQSEKYLRNRLEELRKPVTAGTAMNGIAATLNNDEIMVLAAHLAALP
jgi:cytochrome c553